jgi:tRNA A-37 threonylcarbamoyl transferase component Bud32
MAFNSNFTGEIMKDEVDEDEVDEDAIEERNECIDSVLNELPRNVVNAPFPFTDLDHHFKLARSNAVQGHVLPPIPALNIQYTVKWFGRYVWGGRMPFVHGDLTRDNVVYNPPYLFIIDFEPGHVSSLSLSGNYMENLQKVAGDLCDFFRSIEQLNGPGFIDTVFPGYNFSYIINQWNDNTTPIPAEYIRVFRYFLSLIIEPGRLVALFGAEGGKRKSNRKSKRKSRKYR